MFSVLKQRWGEYQALRRFKNSTIGQMLAHHTESHFKLPRMQALSEETRQTLVSGFYQGLVEIAQADEPFLELRKRIAGTAFELAALQVWCLTEDEKPHTDWAEVPYVSGALHRRIVEAAPHVAELCDVVAEHPNATAEELVDWCNSRTLVQIYFLNGLNYVRHEFDDMRDPDWFRPMITSQMISHEDAAREKLGLPSLLASPVDALVHSTFAVLVEQGEHDPLAKWEEMFPSWTGKGITREDVAATA